MTQTTPDQARLAELIAARYLARRDVKALQNPDGSYCPVPGEFTAEDIEKHLAGTVTHGHYVLSQSSECRMFCIDLDLQRTGTWLAYPELTAVLAAEADLDKADALYRALTVAQQIPLRKAWLNRLHPARPWLKRVMRNLAGALCAELWNGAGLPCAAAYTGSKGVHVYGFTGLVPAAAARAAASQAVEAVRAAEGDCPEYGFGNFTVEIYPKQDEIRPSGYGNLLRLPLGRNLKAPDDPCFFIDMREHTTILPHPDPCGLLETGNPWN